MLGHAPQSVTEGYVHIDEALKLAVTRTSGTIAELLEQGACEATRSARSIAGGPTRTSSLRCPKSITERYGQRNYMIMPTHERGY
jgi:hypothetical protein